ncbi:DKNYY domain-containing protein [Flavobacterium sp. I3-2]|uniref:DKNYY domain-containing protein n=1 Tax=Flavobacterium sp. I3-2 TaxID=2748319 RepID=UPI0015A870E4|nr:DKNYY domain-containing protein [Flavobacterium sp. I3-2]
MTLYKYRYLLYTVILAPLIFLTLFIFGIFTKNNNYSEIDRNGIDINESIFQIYDNQIYALTPSNGYYKVEDASVNTFQTLNNPSFQNGHIGKDEKNVYAGNVILEDLNPQNLRVLANNYYTDGIVTYYSSRNSEQNQSLNTFEEIFQQTFYNLNLGSKPQTYWYPSVKLPDNVNYQSINGNGLTASSDKVYFKGLEMPEANPKTIKPIYNNYENNRRESTSYFTDNKHLYYENKLLDIDYNSSIYELYIEGDVPSRNDYLIDAKNGNIVADGVLFPTENAPYKLLSSNLKHAYQVLFASKNGIYFYNEYNKKVEKISDNPFPNNDFKQLYGDIIISGNNVYYLIGSENWGRGTGLNSRSTHLNLVENLNANDLVEVANINNSGSIWKAKNAYYYFDNLGRGQLIGGPIFQFNSSQDVLNFVKNEDINYQAVLDLMHSNQIFLPDSVNIAEAKTKSSFNNNYNSVYYILGFALFILIVILIVFRNKVLKPYFFEDGYLIINTLLFTKYKITDIEEITFKVNESNITHRYTNAVFKIKTKNGKTSRNYMYSPEVTIFSTPKVVFIEYIQELQIELDSKKIKSTLKLND